MPRATQSESMNQGAKTLSDRKDSARRRILTGVVTRKSGEKTVSVEVRSESRHPLYEKKVIRTKNFLVHDPDDSAQIGSTVKLQETRPLSKRKRWTLIKPT